MKVFPQPLVKGLIASLLHCSVGLGWAKRPAEPRAHMLVGMQAAWK